MNNLAEEHEEHLVREYALLALDTAEKHNLHHVDHGPHAQRAHEVRVELMMDHTSICCMAVDYGLIHDRD